MINKLNREINYDKKSKDRLYAIQNIILIVLVIIILPFTLYGKSEKPLNYFKVKIHNDTIQLRCVKGETIVYSIDKSPQLNTTIAKKPKDLNNINDYEYQTNRYFDNLKKDGYTNVLQGLIISSLNNGNQLNKNKEISGWMYLNVNEKGDIFFVELRFKNKTFLYTTLNDIYEAMVAILNVRLKPIDDTYLGINRASLVIEF